MLVLKMRLSDISALFKVILFGTAGSAIWCTQDDILRLLQRNQHQVETICPQYM